MGKVRQNASLLIPSIVILLTWCTTLIWCRSVHNISIERLWCDVTRGFGLKWHNFFLDLEFACGLNPNLEAHIWLHHLFLSSINKDAQDWAHLWNNHKLQFDNERTRSPQDMFFFGMIQNGPWGLSLDNQPPPVNTLKTLPIMVLTGKTLEMQIFLNITNTSIQAI